MNKKSPFYAKWWGWAIISLFLLLLMVIGPIIINESYKGDAGYITKWGAAEVLSYFASCLAFLGTTIVSAIALLLNHKYTTDSQKREQRAAAINNYVLFDFEEMEATFTVNTSNPLTESTLEPADIINGGFNGTQAIIQNISFTKYETLTLIISIRNISNNVAVQPQILDENGQKVETSNVIHSKGEVNYKKYILSQDNGVIRLSFDMKELKEKKKLIYYLSFFNQFEQQYKQKIIVSYACGNNIIQVDQQCTLKFEELT